MGSITFRDLLPRRCWHIHPLDMPQNAGGMKKPPFLWFSQKYRFWCMCVWGGGSRPPGLRRLAHATANFGHTKPSTVSVFERPEELRTRENLERICKMSDDERFARLCNSNLTILYEKSRLLWNLEFPGFVDFVKTMEMQVFSMSPAFQGISRELICDLLRGKRLRIDP